MIISSNQVVQRDIERLLRESEEISRDWDTYIQFRRNRQAIMERFVSPCESNN